MLIFILEDNPDRMDKFIRELQCTAIHHAETVDAGKELLLMYKYDLLLLDHDLGGEQMVDSAEKNTGYQLAKFITHTQNRDTPCIAHTCNPVGADNILCILPHAIKVPFPVLDLSMVGEFVKHMKGV